MTSLKRRLGRRSGPASAPMEGGFSARDAAAALGLSARRVRGWAGLLGASRDRKGAYRLTFQELSLLRTARELEEARVPRGRVRSAFRRLRELAGRPLSSVRLVAEGRELLAREGELTWEPASGQLVLDFGGEVQAPAVASRRIAPATGWGPRSAEEWYEVGCALEGDEPGEAIDAYRRSAELDPAHADARVNLGCLLHERGELAEAEQHYRDALAAAPEHATAAYNLGVVLEDQGRPRDAAAFYQRALAADPRLADAHYNLSRLLEGLGDRAAAFRHLKTYRELTHG